ncbi:6255_t:CDS:2, partial [Ambispora leptoticha]
MSQNLRKEAATRASRHASKDMWSETSADTVDSWTSAGSKNAEDGILEEVNWEDEVSNSP